MNAYEIFDNKYLKEKKITSVIDYLSSKIDRTVMIFVKNDSFQSKLIYSTKKGDENLTIKLLIEDDHCSFIHDSINLEKKRKIFCDFCQ